MTLKLACADFSFPLLDHDKVLDLIALLEFRGVDIGLFEGRSHLWPSRVFEDVRGSARALAAKLSDRGLEAADVFLQTAPDFVTLAPNHPDAGCRRRARDWFQKAVEFAAECGCRHVSALPGVHFDDEPKADSWRRSPAREASPSGSRRTSARSPRRPPPRPSWSATCPA